MKLEIFCVYDSKATAYLPPFFLPMMGQATRIFQNCANDDSHAFGANPGDYTLFHLGHFDDNNAKITKLPTPASLGLAQEYRDAPRIEEPNFDLADTIANQEKN